MDDKSRIKLLFQASENMILATADISGQPWVTPVTYATDETGALYWISAKSARHSCNIRKRSAIAIVIYTTDVRRDALYIEAEAVELTHDEAISDAIEVMGTRNQPRKYQVKDLASVSGQAVWRIYKAVPKKLYLREESEVNKQAVTTRRQVNL